MCVPAATIGMMAHLHVKRVTQLVPLVPPLAAPIVSRVLPTTKKWSTQIPLIETADLPVLTLATSNRTHSALVSFNTHL